MSKHSILIIDDETKLLKSMEKLFKDEFHIHTAPSGKEGLMILDRQHISMVLLDLNMPQMTGVEVLEEIRKKGYSVKVVIMTGGRNYEWTRRCADLSVHGFIEKPFDPDELIKRINNILSAKKDTKIQEILENEFDKKKRSLNPIFAKAISYIEDNFPKELSREEIAAKLDISPQYLSTLFKEECGLQLKEFINRCRIERSLEFIKDNPSLPVKDLAESVGMNDQNYFCRLFKKHTGKTPTDFKKIQTAQTSENKEEM